MLNKSELMLAAQRLDESIECGEMNGRPTRFVAKLRCVLDIYDQALAIASTRDSSEEAFHETFVEETGLAVLRVIKMVRRHLGDE